MAVYTGIPEDRSLLSKSVMLRNVVREWDIIVNIIKNVPKNCEKDIISKLNEINNQGIESIDFMNLVYTIHGEIVGISAMSHGELVMLTAYAAEDTACAVCFSYDFWSLSSRMRNALLDLCKTSKYVSVVIGG